MMKRRAAIISSPFNRKAKRRTGLATVLVILAITVGTVRYFYQRDIHRARLLASTDSVIAETRCGLIEYATIGKGNPILLVHGAGGGFDQSLYFGHPLADRGFRIIAPSRFGYLRTPLPADASPAAQADAYACLLDALGIPRAGVIGVSAGAPSAMQFALRHPRRTTALVLAVPLTYAPKTESVSSSEIGVTTAFLFETVLKSDFLFWAAAKRMPDVLTRAILATPPEVMAHTEEEEQIRAKEILYRILPVSRRQQGLMNDARIATSLTRYELEQIKTPTLIFSVKDDLFQTYESARYTAQHIPGARFIGYESGGHVWIGHHEEVLSTIAAGLR